MATKTSLTPIIRAHFNTLRNAKTGRLHWPDFVVQFGLPVLLGIGFGLSGGASPDISTLLTVVSILAGLSFALALFVFELRQNLSTRYEKTSTMLARIDVLFQNVLYSVIVGLTSTGTGAFSSVVGLDTTIEASLQVLTLVLTAHFFLVLFMCLKRLNAVFRESRR